MTFGSIFFGTVRILPTQKDAARNLGRFTSKGGHRTIRFAFTDDRQAHEQHQNLHVALVENAHCLIELRSGGHYGAIDIDDPSKIDLVTGVLAPHHAAGYLIWEWADPPASD